MALSYLKSIFQKEKILRLLISLGLAIMIWIIALSDSSQVIRKRFNDIPLAVKNLQEINAKGFTVEPMPISVNIQLRGQISQISAISKDRLTAYVDLSYISAVGNYNRAVAVDNIPSGINILAINPEQVNVVVSEIKSKSFNFSIANFGSLSVGYELLALKYDLTPVLVHGSELALASISKVEGKLDLTNRNDDFIAHVMLFAYDAQGKEVQNISISPSSISVSIAVGKSKRVMLSAKSKGVCASGYFAKSIEPVPKEIVISGKEILLENITELLLEPVDINGKYEAFQTNGVLALPSGISVASDPKIVVKVDIVPIDLKELKFETIQIRNTPPGLKLQPYEPGAITLTLMAAPGGFDGLKQSDCILYVDLAELGPGEHSVKLQYELPKGISIKDVSRDDITIILTEL